MIFNTQQENIINMGVEFLLHSDEKVFQYDGQAGTGKSVVMMEIFRRAGYKPYEILPMAYTGQAAIVMRTKGFLNAKSLHSGLFDIEHGYKTDEFNHPVIDTYFNSPETTDYFVPKEVLPQDIKAIAIDEGSMIPLEMKQFIEKYNKKIIVTGDIGQLPPINSSPAYLTDPNIPHLVELMRQKENDGIVYIARRARAGLPINIGSYGNALVIEESELSDDMILSSNVVLCGTNRKRDIFNKYIRNNLLNIRDTLPVFGDKVICRKNNWNVEIDGISLANGLVGTVTAPPSVATFDGKIYCMDFMPDLLNKSFHSIPCDYEYLIGDIETRRKIKNSKYSVGEKFEYAYSSTTHLAQGAEYNCGIYVEEYLGDDIQNNLNYSGITRFRNWIIYVKKNRKYY